MANCLFMSSGKREPPGSARFQKVHDETSTTGAPRRHHHELDRQRTVSAASLAPAACVLVAFAVSVSGRSLRSSLIVGQTLMFLVLFLFEFLPVLVLRRD